MAQIFRSVHNTLFRVSLSVIVLLGASSLWLAGAFERSPYKTLEKVPRDQPVPFSHQHHVGGIGIDCRYCHVSVETSRFAGIPAVSVCMNCHSQIWADSPALAPVREASSRDQTIEWTRVNDLPDFVYFDHSIHVNKGVGCTTCHGRIDQMPLVWKANSLHMEWCLECHRNPEKYVRRREDVFKVDWEPPKNQREQGRALVEQYQIRKVTDCYGCHR
ncbi:MAG: cytochrome c3 family protein [Deltaproteobacteria bacterium]|nr:cytochrome c3 family protein [Deltaproteobacteria bacterium]